MNSASQAQHGNTTNDSAIETYSQVRLLQCQPLARIDRARAKPYRTRSIIGVPWGWTEDGNGTVECYLRSNIDIGSCEDGQKDKKQWYTTFTRD